MLGVERLVLGIHDQMLPASAGEDLGRGAPLSPAAQRFFAFGRALGFNALQLGPQGETSRSNPSPYDSAAFARDPAALSLAALARPEFGELLRPEEVAAAALSSSQGDRTSHADAYDKSRALIGKALQRLGSEPTAARRELALRHACFAEANEAWLDRDGLFAALSREHGSDDPRAWPALDAALWDPAPGQEVAASTRRRALREQHATLLEAHSFTQFLCHGQHADLLSMLAEAGVTVFGDLQIGLSLRDRWAFRSHFLKDLVMGAPPSRTTPVGQPWGYPVLDPRQVNQRFAGPNPPGLGFVRLRLDKALREYDGLRIDHPHGWVCPWVYREGTSDPVAAVNDGRRLFESPDDPELADFAIARPAQLRRDRPLFDDGWVSDLDEAQVAAYGELSDVLLDCADRAGRPRALLLWELLSTQPYPLERVLQRQGLGRCRVTQKVRLGDPADAYRSELAKPQDWMMVGNHDTQPIWTVVRRWLETAQSQQRAAYMAERLCPDPSRRERLATVLAAEPALLAQAQFADLFASKARQVLIFVSDLLGETRSYNVPGVVHPDNWTLRVPADFEGLYAARAAKAEALDMPLCLVLALDAQGAKFARAQAGLRAALLAAAAPSSVQRLGL